LIRAVKDSAIGQLLVSVVASGGSFATFSGNFQFAEFWHFLIALFIFAPGFMLHGRVVWIYYCGRSR
jgi:hypothetical protein